jgi:hypothetical protein
MPTVKEVFDKAVELSSGEKIVIPLPSSIQRESLRTALFRERRAWKEKMNPTCDILIQRGQLQKNPTVILTKTEDAPPALLMDKDGNITGVMAESVSNIKPDDTDRIVEAMKADGFTEEEIEDFLKGGVDET